MKTTDRTIRSIVLTGGVVLVLAASLRAGPRSSTSYTITADTVSNGGSRTTSTTYTNDGSAGGIVGISTVATPAETVKHGYAGQLYDVTSLGVNSAAPSVNEAATVQLAAWQALDDASFLAVPASSITWSVPSGPLSGINSTGLATAAIVYEDTAAVAQGSYLGLTGTLGLTVLNVNTDDIPGYAADGINDAWQVQHFGLNNPHAVPAFDPDGDGQSNLFEWNARTDPGSNASWFRVTQSALSGSTFSVTFPTVLGRSYQLQASPNLAPPWTPVGSATPGTGGNVTLPANVSGFTGQFFRVSVGDP